MARRFEAAEDMAVLRAFVELAGQRSGPVMDAGCGPGRVTRFLADAGLDVVGVDVAEGMMILVGFQSGVGERAERPDAYGSGIDLTLFRHDPDVVCDGLRRASFRVRSVTRRAPTLERETTGQAFVMADRAAKEALMQTPQTAEPS